MTSINVRCSAPLRSALTALPSFFSSRPCATYTHPHPLMCGGSRSMKPTTRTANKSPGSGTQTDVIKMSTPLGMPRKRLSYHTSASLTKASPGTFFWCNGTLRNCMNSSDPGPCFVVTIVPQLTLYGESELTGCSLHPIPGPAGLPSSLSC
uniref:Uncharacterized protein n=1 Tax=Myotis myotis TaxID=51298 RepID=A0A7J7YE45_MYOMY|nr:hypothetical protein mMyoMyo1_011102 [Myotis myotis]